MVYISVKYLYLCVACWESFLEKVHDDWPVRLWTDSSNKVVKTVPFWSLQHPHDFFVISKNPRKSEKSGKILIHNNNKNWPLHITAELIKMVQYSWTSYNPYPSVDSPGYGFTGGGKKVSAHKSHESFEKILFSLLQ